MKTLYFSVCALFLLLASVVRAAEPQLRYDIETLNGAKSAELISPGADGSEYALKLTHDAAMWSRFNWPMFRPIFGASSICISVKRQGSLPHKLQVRILTADGVEWQSTTFETHGGLAENNHCRLTLSAFSGGRIKTSAINSLSTARCNSRLCL